MHQILITLPRQSGTR